MTKDEKVYQRNVGQLEPCAYCGELAAVFYSFNPDATPDMCRACYKAANTEKEAGEAAPSVSLPREKLREQLAALAHEQWSGWMKHLFSRAVVSGHGTVTLASGDLLIRAEVADRWRRQMNSTYAVLNQAEKNSDREEADCVLAILREASLAPTSRMESVLRCVKCQRFTTPLEAALRIFNPGRCVDCDEPFESVTPFKEAVSLAPSSGWQPIASAPKDGTAILGYGRHVGSPPDAQRGVTTGDHWWSIMVWDIWRPSESHHWVFAKDGKWTWSDPTHWQPLPLPPVVLADQEPSK